MGKLTGQDIINGYQNEKKKKKLTGQDILNGYESSKSSGKWYDGYFQESQGNLGQTVVGSATDVGTHGTGGLLEMGETIFDALLYASTYFTPPGQEVNLSLTDLQNRQKMNQEIIQKNLYDGQEVAKSLISDNVKNVTGIDSETMSAFGEKSDAIAASGGQLLGQIGASAINPYLGLATIGASSFGGEVENAFNNGATYEEAGVSGAITAGGEVLTEKLFGYFGSKGMDKIINKTLANKLSNSAVRTLAKVGVDASGEGAEEVLSGVTSAIGQKLTYMDEKELNELFSSEEAIDSFVAGAVLGSVGGGVDAAKSAVTGKDMVTDLTKNEETVVEAIAQERMEENKAGLGQVTSEKDSKKQLQQYREEAREMLKNGEVSVDAIEKALGGDTLAKYNDSVSLLEEYNKLNRIKASDLTGEQSDRLAELKEQVKAGTLSEDGNKKLKQQLSEQVSRLTENDQYIRESYNEKAKRSQAFEADLSQYDEKAQATIQKAIDSGILNNTKKTHAFVDLVAKLSADKGVVFDFSNSERIKASGFSIDGKTVNGYVQGNNITLNINSAQALNKVVGHEITHVLEGTDLCNELQNTVMEYAKSKGEYDDRLQDIVQRYRKQFEGQETEARMQQYKAELTADLVGELVFSDTDFVNRLSVEKPNIFQKLFEEIKYMCKIATAGSQEAKKLEKVKRAFEKAYRESSANTNANTKFSIEQINGKKKNYGIGVVLDTNLFEGIKPRNWSNVVKDYVYNNLAGTELTVYNEGVAETIYLAKRNERATKDGAKNPHKVIDKLARNRNGDNIRNLSVVHIDELAAVSRFQDNSTEHSHQWLDENGWEFRTAYAQDKDGRIYELNLNIAKGRDGRKILYDINKINEIDHGDVASKGLAHKNQSHKSSISQSAENTTGNAKLSVSDSQGRELSAETNNFFRYAQTRDENGALKPYYHGTARGDRVGYRFDPERATSGPMAFFTDSEEIAGNYARDKQDTSLAYDEQYDSYETQFRVNRNGKNMSVVELWNTLSMSERNEIKEKAKHITMDDDWENVIYNEEAEYGLGNFDAYELNAHRGNALHTLVDSWLTDGNIYGEEQKFLDVLKLVGIEDAEYMDPNKREEKVYAVYLNVTNPLRTEELDQQFVDELHEWLDNEDLSAYQKESSGADMWDKNSIDPYEWLDRLQDDVNNGTTHAWTSIPDAITGFLKEKGYDGIFDAGGKGGGAGHQVVIPFYSNQIKDVTNQNPTLENEDIRFSLGEHNGRTSSRHDVYGKDISLDLPIRSDIAPVQEDAEEVNTPLQENTTPDLNLPTPETVQAEEAAVTPPEKWLENKLARIEKHLARDIEEVNAEYNERIANAFSRQAIEGIETERLHKVDELEAEAEKERAKARDSAETINRKELHQTIINDIKAWFAEHGFDFDKVLTDAKNKSTFSSVDNTPQRVMEKTLGYKEGQLLADATINKTALNESKAVEWLNHFTNRKNGVLAQIVKEYGIKPRSKESAAAQMYGEGFYVNDKNEYVRYGDAELAKDFPNVDTQEKIKRLAKDTRIRQIYDETLDAINASRRRNGYPEIPRRKDYFLHFQAMTDTFSTSGIPFNPNDIRAKDLPTDLNGVTADLKPGQPYFASANQRKGIRTTYDLLGGLEQYLTSAKNQIYHIDDIQTFRALRNYVADTFGQAHGFDDLDELSEAEVEERIKNIKDAHLSTFAKFLNEQANIMAGKTALLDRGLEGFIGRRGITFLKDLNQQVGSNMVGYNLSSSLTNLVSMVQGFAKANKSAAMKALAQTTANKINGIFGRSDGFLEADPLYIRRNGADKFTRTAWDVLKEPGYLLSGAVDSISTEFLVRCKYNELIQKGMDDAKAHIEADKWAVRILGDRTYGQMPQLYNSQMLGLVTKFQLEVRNQLDSMFYDTIQEKTLETENVQDELKKNSTRAAKIASTFFQLAVFQHVFGQAFEAIAGYNPAFDIIEVMIKTLGFDDEEDSEDTIADNLNQGFQALLEDLPYTSVILDGGRIPISSALPIGEMVKQQDQYGNPKPWYETALEALPYYVLPGGYGQIKKTFQGLSMFDDNLPVSGSYTQNGIIDKVVGRSPGKLRYEVEETPLSMLQAAVFGQYASENARDYFDNSRTPLTPSQLEEFTEVDMPMKDYWEYREGLKEHKKNTEKADYIANLDLPIDQKNILVNNVYDDRDTPIDLSGYENYGNFEEFDFAMTEPEKYTLVKPLGGWESYSEYKEALKGIEGDKDEDGETVNGSIKKNYINALNDMDIEYGQKLLLFKDKYKADDSYNLEIINYLNEREDITAKEMRKILEALDFTVDESGKITW